ncbi:MAG: DNA polymerase III subunit gamma [Candidatus Westeberhardia cardiocondylae]|nr:DNA polymerase III subunit gamma [Candidatus Westeberhardia cardiocondylae]
MFYRQALARMWRPKTFDDVVGQDHILQVLKNSFTLKRIHHAYLFSGMHGIGKTSIARLMVKSLNCQKGITISPCKICDNCLQIEKGNFIDFIEVDAASRAKIEDIRELLENVQYMPIKGRFKIYLIDEVHMLSRYSFNTLLNVLEEPPEYVKFFFATTDLQKIPITVLSRCLLFYLRALLIDQILEKLKLILSHENIIFEDRALYLLSCESKGSMRDALSLTDQAVALGNGVITTEIVQNMFGFIDKRYSLSLIESTIFGDIKNVILQLDQYYNLGLNWESLLVDMISLLHHISFIQLSCNTFLEKEYFYTQYLSSRLNKIASYINIKDVQCYYQILLQTRKELPYAPSYRIGIEMSLFKIFMHSANKKV